MWFSSPKPRTMDRHLVSLLAPASFEAEQYRQLRQRVEALGQTRSLRVLAVTSAIPGDGKTLTAVNLAASLAQRVGARILIVDADLRHPTVATTLGLESTKAGFEAAMQAGAGTLQQFIEPVAPGLSVLACTPGCERPYELLTSPHLAELFGETRRDYDCVVVDTPPIIPVQDSTLMASVVDGYIMVVSANSTPRQLVREALTRLPPEMYLGLVFNRDDSPLFGYYGTYYDGYIRPYGRSAWRRT